MKIAINTRFLIDDNLEGIGRFTFEIVKRLIEENPEHHFYLLFDRKWEEKYDFRNNATNIKISPPARHPILWKIWYELSIPRKLKRIKPDVFLSLDGYTSLKWKGKKITVVHDIAFEHYPKAIDRSARNFLKLYTPQYCNSSDKIIAVSEFTKKDIIDKYSISEEKIEVVYNAVSDNFGTVTSFNPKEKFTNGESYFLYVGSIQPRKNIENVLLAYDQFRKTNFRKYKLLIVGRKAWKYKSVEDTYNSMKFKDDVIFTGYVDEKELPSYYHYAFATLYLSFFEGFGIPIIESQKCGTPVITSNTSCMPEIAKSGALFANPFDVKSIVSKMGELVNTPGLHQQLSYETTENVERFSWDNSSKKLMQIIKEVTSY